MTRKNKLICALVIVLTVLLIGISVFGIVQLTNNEQKPISETDNKGESQDTPSIDISYQTGEAIVELEEGNEVFLDENLLMQLVRIETGVPMIDDIGNYITDNSGALVYTDGDEDAVNGILDRLIVLINCFSEKEYSLEASRQAQRLFFEYRSFFSEMPESEMCNMIGLCIPPSGTDPEALSINAAEIFGINRDDGFAFVFDSVPVSTIEVHFSDVKPPISELSDETMGLCLFSEYMNPDDNGYERNMEAWLHQIISIVKTEGYSDNTAYVAQLLYIGSLCDAEYRSDWAEALLRCVSDENTTFDLLKEKVLHEFGVNIDYNAPLIDYYAKG